MASVPALHVNCPRLFEETGPDRYTGSEGRIQAYSYVTTRPDNGREKKASAGPAAAGGIGGNGLYGFLLLVAASIAGARILTAPGAFTVNDQSRWSTVRALVDTGSYAIGHRQLNPDGSYRDFGIIAQRGWDTADRVMHR